MFTLSAFADEISPDPQEQIDVLASCGIRHIEFRSIHKTNVLSLSDAQLQDFKSLLDANGFRLSAIGSPIGKIRIDEPFEPHLEKLPERTQADIVTLFTFAPSELQDPAKTFRQFLLNLEFDEPGRSDL